MSDKYSAVKEFIEIEALKGMSYEDINNILVTQHNRILELEGKQRDYKNSECFDSLDEEQRNKVMDIVARFHYRNGRKQSDGSMGEIRITPGELNNCLASMLIKENTDVQ